MKKYWNRLRDVDRVAILAIVGVGLLVVLKYFLMGVWIHRNEPVYPAYSKPATSISELQAELAAHEPTKGLVVVDASDRISGQQSFEIMLDKTTRDAEPEGYCISWTDAEADGLRPEEITGWLRPEGFQLYGGTYRDQRIKLETFPEDPRERYMKLWLLCGDYYYTVSASFETAGLSEQDITEQEEALQAFLYAIADRIIDAAQAQ